MTLSILKPCFANYFLYILRVSNSEVWFRFRSGPTFCRAWSESKPQYPNYLRNISADDKISAEGKCLNVLSGKTISANLCDDGTNPGPTLPLAIVANLQGRSEIEYTTHRFQHLPMANMVLITHSRGAALTVIEKSNNTFWLKPFIWRQLFYFAKVLATTNSEPR